jgi:predicted peptidase
MKELGLPGYASLLFEAKGGTEGRPLLVFLHGGDERGSDLEKLKAHGPPHLFPRYGLDRFSVLAPQCPEGKKWEARFLAAFVDAAVDRIRPDPGRIYVTGISMGGYGTWELAARTPERYAAVAVICGGGATEHAASFSSLPLWLFHSASDERVRVERGDELFEALQQQNTPVTYTRYADASHVDTWQRAYGSTILFDWFLQHTR